MSDGVTSEIHLRPPDDGSGWAGRIVLHLPMSAGVAGEAMGALAKLGWELIRTDEQDVPDG